MEWCTEEKNKKSASLQPVARLEMNRQLASHVKRAFPISEKIGGKQTKKKN
jgi:hypothetical protein